MARKEYRYRDSSGGVTERSLQRMYRNLYKIGRPVYVKGYRFTSTRSRNATQPYTTDYESVLVRGVNGTARFDGFCWGYGGEGPRGLVTLLKYLGLDKYEANKVSQNPRGNEDGVDWAVHFSAGRLIYWQIAGVAQATQVFDYCVPNGYYDDTLPYQKDARQWYISVSYSVTENEWGSLDYAAEYLAKQRVDGAGTGFGRRDLSFYFKNHTDAQAAKERFEQRGEEFRVDQFCAVDDED